MATRRAPPATPQRTPVESFDDVPAFRTEAEEAAYWSTHSFGEGVLREMRPIPPEGDGVLPPARPPAPRTRPIAVRLDADVLRRLKALAATKRKGYQTLLKEFVVERLYEEEKRAGLIPL
jgi:hypothetical protein